MPAKPLHFWKTLTSVALDAKFGKPSPETKQLATEMKNVVVHYFAHRLSLFVSPVQEKFKELKGLMDLPARNLQVQIANAGLKTMVGAAGFVLINPPGAEPEVTYFLKAIAAGLGIASLNKTTAGIVTSICFGALVKDFAQRNEPKSMHRTLHQLFMKSGKVQSSDEIKKAIAEDAVVQSEIKRNCSHHRFDPVAFQNDNTIPAVIRDSVLESVRVRQISFKPDRSYEAFERLQKTKSNAMLALEAVHRAQAKAAHAAAYTQ